MTSHGHPNVIHTPVYKKSNRCIKNFTHLSWAKSRKNKIPVTKSGSYQVASTPKNNSSEQRNCKKSVCTTHTEPNEELTTAIAAGVTSKKLIRGTPLVQQSVWKGFHQTAGTLLLQRSVWTGFSSNSRDTATIAVCLDRFFLKQQGYCYYSGLSGQVFHQTASRLLLQRSGCCLEVWG